jgi:hypothetical protein
MIVAENLLKDDPLEVFQKNYVCDNFGFMFIKFVKCKQKIRKQKTFTQFKTREKYICSNKTRLKYMFTNKHDNIVQ